MSDLIGFADANNMNFSFIALFLSFESNLLRLWVCKWNCFLLL